ncbi:MAG: phosphocholine cytidylyltransferase family protein [Coriobacteriales bacterium]|jgi:choline kinase|nr:phosphocholine cytidylyltransferase family protein [Coriobacteriales bacterium]
MTRALFLAAGVGSRLGVEANRAKCTYEVGDGPLIANTMRKMAAAGISTAVVVGFCKDSVAAALADFPEVRFFENPFYRITNSIGSLWIAREYLQESAEQGEDIILANADVFWGDDILKRLSGYQSQAVMLGDHSRAQVGDYFFQLQDGQIVAYGKQLAPEQRSCEYVGAAKLAAGFLPTFIANLERLIWNEDYDMWWEDVLYRSCAEFPVEVIDVEGAFWAEVDYIDDYRRILQHEGLNEDEFLQRMKLA